MYYYSRLWLNRCVYYLIQVHIYLAMDNLHTEQLKYGFCKKSPRKDAPLTSWTLFSSVFFQISTDLEKKRGEKVFNWSEVHFSNVTFNKIHILVGLEVWNESSNKSIVQEEKKTNASLRKAYNRHNLGLDFVSGISVKTVYYTLIKYWPYGLRVSKASKYHRIIIFLS